MATEKIKGQVNTWEEMHGVTRATFCQGFSEVRAGLKHKCATLFIHDDHSEAVFTASEVAKMVTDGVLSFAEGVQVAGGKDSLSPGVIKSIFASQGITL